MIYLLELNTPNTMTNEQITEELLFEAHKDGIFRDVMILSEELKIENPKIGFDEAIYKAVHKVRQELVE